MLNKKQKYLQVALNSTLNEAQKIVSQLPLDRRIIIEAGTPLIKTYGKRAIQKIRFWWQQRVFEYTMTMRTLKEIKTGAQLMDLLTRSLEREEIPFAPYIVADLKCMDRGAREVEIARNGGADAAVVLGQAPIQTIDSFIEQCEKYKIDSMVDMMNIEYSLEVLRQLKKLPQVVILHRGVDEESFDPESEIPYHEIHRIKENYDIMVAVAGGDTIGEVQRAIFNDADIVVVWKSFYQSTAETAKLAAEFLKEIRG